MAGKCGTRGLLPKLGLVLNWRHRGSQLSTFYNCPHTWQEKNLEAANHQTGQTPRKSRTASVPSLVRSTYLLWPGTLSDTRKGLIGRQREDAQPHLPKMSKELVKKGSEDEYTIKPQAVTPAIDTSAWPLLLKNYEKREWQLLLKQRLGG